jgi:hypothetical protein
MMRPSGVLTRFMANTDYQVSNKHTTKFIGTLNESISLPLACRAGATGECIGTTGC